MAVAVSFVVIQGNTVEATHFIESVADTRQDTPSNLDSAAVFCLLLPVDMIGLQASFKDTEVKLRIVRNQDTTAHRSLDLFPQFRKGWGI